MSDRFALNYRYDYDPGYGDPDPEQYLDDYLDDLIYARYGRLHDRLMDEEMGAEFRSVRYFDDVYYDYEEDVFHQALDDLLEGPREVELPPRFWLKTNPDRRPRFNRREQRDSSKPTSWKAWRQTQYRYVLAR